jgi:nucleoside-diphosphate-sugar epimerase
MKVFVTGGTGFIGGHVVRKLRQRGDEVVALVRNPEKASDLEALGSTVIAGDLDDTAAIRGGMEGCDAAIHGAAVYEVGIPANEREPMRRVNVVGTENVLRSAREARLAKIVYISTIAAFGNTHGEVVDESYEHPRTGFTSYYEETKEEAHRVAQRLIEEGLPLIIVQPGGVYGPRYHSMVGKQIKDFVAGRMPAIAFPDLGLNAVHVEDVADGVLLALDKGEPGEAYVLGGEITTMRGVIDAAASVTRKEPPKRTMPVGVLKAMRPLGPVVGKLMRQPPNLGELISSADGVTFWARHDKAIAELGYSPRGLEQGLRDMLEAEGKPAAAA